MKQHWWARAVLALACMVLAACGPKPPIRIGFLGGVAAQGFNVSEDGRNGALLAVEAINRTGGVRGRPLELVVREITFEKQHSQAMTEALLSARVEAMVGPFTSTQALAVLAQADAAGTLFVSPTANAPELGGRDDHFIRLNGALADSAAAYAALLVGRGQRRVAVAFDESNLAYSGQWLAAFRTSLAARGGAVVGETGFVSGPELPYAAVVRSLLAPAPDALLFIGRGADAARLAQQVRKQGSDLPLAAAEWAATESLIELGGQAVEGLLTAEPYDPSDTSARYQEFHRNYRARYGREPGFGALGSYDAVTVLAEAMARARQGESLKDAVLRHGPYQGLQHPIAIDRFGDSQRPLHFVVVRQGAFASLR
ncbi:ABC transporter substrate-binding protein [Pseudorhodoferax sp.]|uniref:ABC transporter substrate-binding protein n=1 Tax=Pseudorhodoferax sp. TaxID=1993553 RepID=UPI002DD61A5D|nr:ABC transporter substrate-binding protein [Pseudorhodoferax sp.]